MDTKELTHKLSEKTGRTPQEIENLISGLSTVIKEKCSDMDSIAIPGFGSFEPRKRMERITVHPSTGKRIMIPPKISLTFKMSAVLKQKLRAIE